MKLKHLKGRDLEALELLVKKIKIPIEIVNVNNVGGLWYIHFLVSWKFNTDDIEIKNENVDKIESEVINKNMIV